MSHGILTVIKASLQRQLTAATKQMGAVNLQNNDLADAVSL